MKKNIVSVIIVNLFVLGAILGMISNSKVVNQQFDYLNDNQIRIYNSSGFTTEQMNEISKQDGVTDVVFDHRNIFPTYELETEYGAVGVQGISIEENNQYQKGLDYLAGGPLTELYQVIITQSLADKLIELGFAKDYDGLIGTDLVKGLEIVGVYLDPIDFQVDEYNQHTIIDSQQTEQFVQISDSTYLNSFMLFNRGREYDKDALITAFNLDVAWQYEADTKDYDRYIYSGNDSDPGNDEEPYHVNYDESIANGATGLIDPATTAYRDEFNQFGFIETSGDRDQVVEKLATEFPDAAIITNDTQFSDFQNNTATYIKLVIAVIIFELFIFVPLFRNSRLK